MRIGIVGAGSIGLLFAAYLHRVFEVTLYTRTEAQADWINKHGVQLKKGIGPLTAQVNAVPLDKGIGEAELTIIAVKQYQLESILEGLPQGGNYLFLQNGMGHLNALAHLSAENIYVGSVEHGALRENPTTVSHNGAGITRVAVYRGSSELLENFARNVPDFFPIQIAGDYYKMLANKLAANAVINPLTAILGVNNGELVNNKYFEKALEGLFDEVAQILSFTDRTNALTKVKGICRNTAENRSSMLKDLDAGRPTEVDAILGFLVDEAYRKKLKTPMISTYYHLIKGRELASRREMR
ncbi:2-dehydropantoate 2-reductase [Neobacillus notoginsengisoli]|uniref:2-dehydropantoate 2-reductase n=1 Tax=Neobacillus notoginsengisoli TaxID=1578198 RepID=A0A417YQI5_9BACI|nr:2-dehydropantoate 2-reductase [Neobacillus notoginsengisoli]RHW36509.1 2-dehydropantoate 2-reductase [Neobacillus notoginsengisoli]